MNWRKKFGEGKFLIFLYRACVTWFILLLLAQLTFIMFYFLKVDKSNILCNTKRYESFHSIAIFLTNKSKPYNWLIQCRSIIGQRYFKIQKSFTMKTRMLLHSVSTAKIIMSKLATLFFQWSKLENQTKLKKFLLMYFSFSEW